MKFYLLIIVSFFISTAWGYPQYFDRGIQSCSSCHSNGLGAGRSFSAIEDTKINQTWNPLLRYRHAYIERNPNGYDNQSRWMHMQIDAGLEWLSEDRKTLVHYVIGHQPTIQNQGANELSFKTRVAWLKYDLSTQDSLYAGLIEKVYGLRIADHTAFSRSSTGFTAAPLQGLGISPGFIWHRHSELMDFALNFFIKNDEEAESISASGSSGLLEFQILDKFRFGVSALDSKSTTKRNSMQALHFRCCTDSDLKWLAEFGTNQETPTSTETKVKSNYSLHQLWWIQDSEFQPFASYETLKSELESEWNKYGFGAQWNFQEHFEVQLLAQKQNLATKSSWWIVAGILIYL